MEPSMKVLISGAGIAGPALAYWLHRHGAHTTVVEVAPGLRPGGQAVDIRGAARDVVARTGLAQPVREHGLDERGFALVNRRGRRTATMPAAAFGGEGIVAEVEILRGDLNRILYDATSHQVEYRFGDRITGLTQDADGVDVRFASGRADRYDVVVGADGVRSPVRALAFGPDERFVAPLGVYAAYYTVPDPGDLDHWFLMYNAPGGLVAGLRPERGGLAKAYLSFTAPPLEPVRADPSAQRDLLAERFAGAGWRVPALLAALPDAPDFYFDALSRVTVENWARGRVVLLGDAGYCGSPLAGLGTSMALVGAYVLAGELATACGGPADAFAGYQRELRDYVADGTRLPPGGVRAYAPRTQLMISLRALSMRTMTRWPARARVARQFGRAERIAVKDYGLALPAGL
jgi:2-polyprenyl-6-methoxyphenol hydroxylase-like FAD-dependent oxidoreductase